MNETAGGTNIGLQPNSSDTKTDSAIQSRMFEAIINFRDSSSKNCEDELIQHLDDIIKNTNADLNIKNTEGNTVLHLSVEKLLEKTVRFLLKKGAQTNIDNDNGETPIDLAGNNLTLLRILVQSSPVSSVLYSSHKHIQNTIHYNQNLRLLNITCKQCGPDFLSQDEFHSMMKNARCLCVVVVKSKYFGEINDEDVISKLSTYKKTLVLQCGSKVYVKIKGMLHTIIFNIDENHVNITNVTKKLDDETQFSLELVVEALLCGCHNNPTQDSFDINKLWGGRTLIDHAVVHNDYLTTHFLSTLKPCLTKLNEKNELTLELAINHADPNTLSALLGVKMPRTPNLDSLKIRKSQMNHLLNSLFVVMVSDERHFLIKDRIDNAKDEIELWEIFDDIVKRVGVQLQTDTDEIYPPSGIAEFLNLARAGRTALMIAVEKKCLSLVSLLIRCGADVNCLDKNKQRAIDIAWNYDEWDFHMLTVLLEADSEWPVDFRLDHPSEDNADERCFRKFVNERDAFHNSIGTVTSDEMKAFFSRHTISRFVNTEGKSLLETAVNMPTDDVNTVRALIELRIPYSSSQKQFTASPCQQTDGNGNTLLMISAGLGHKNVVRYLLQCESDVEHSNNHDERAIDRAWKNKKYDVVLILLEADSFFPEGYEGDEHCDTETGAALRSFVGDRDRFHTDIERGILQKDYIAKKKSQWYLNSKNNSALFTAVKSNQFDMYVLLKSDYDVHFKNHEEINAISELTPDQKEKFNKILIPRYFESENSHILYLLSKSRSSKHFESFDEKMRFIYNELDSIEQVSQMLKVIPYIDSLDVIFDFDESVTLGTDAEGSVSESGNSRYNEGRIYIGANVSNSELLGTLTHEFSHLVMQMMFNNECKPYDTVEMERKFQDVVEEVKGEKFKDIVLNNAFKYSEWHIHSELIVRVPHMLAKYGSSEGIRLLSEQAPSLLNYYKNVIEPRFKSFMEERFFVKPLNTMKQLNRYLGAIHDIERLNINFKTPIDIENFLIPENEENILLWNTSSTQLSMMNIYQGLQQKHYDSFIFLKSNRIKDLMTEIILTFKSKTCSLLVVENSSEANVECLRELFGYIAQYLFITPNKKVIFISNDSTLDIFSRFNPPEEKLKHSNYEFTLKDFTDESQSLILSRDIIFQGNRLTLNQLIENNRIEIEIDSDSLAKLVDGGTLNIGKITSMTCDDHSDYYIPRYFNKIRISDEILKSLDLKNNIIVISGSTEEDLRKKVSFGGEIMKFPNGDNVSNESEPTRLVIIDDVQAEEDFELFCKKHSTYNIHWLKNESGRLIWQKTHGLLSRILPFRLPDVNIEEESEVENHNLYSEKSLLKQKNQLVIISDTAGMGKSTVLPKIIQLCKDNDKSIWIERIDLNNYSVMFEKYLKICEADANLVTVDTSKLSAQVDLKEYKNTISFEKMLDNQDVSYFKDDKWRGVNVGVKFLIRMLEGIDNVPNRGNTVGKRDKSGETEENHSEHSKLRTTFEKDLFARCFQITGKVILCFDGFDEISPKFKFIVNSLLKSLKCTKVRAIFVTTRSHMRRGLEEQFGTMAYTFSPLTTNQQREFLSKFWGNNPVLSVLHTEKTLKKHAKTLIDLLANSIKDKDRTFTGIPLQIKMLAEAFEPDLKSSEPKFPEMLDMIGLYEKFIGRKYEIFAIEKKQSTPSISAVEDDDDKLYAIFINEHKYAALYILFDNEGEIDLLLPENKREDLDLFLHRIQNGRERTGIIIQHDHDDKPQFTHRTFAEYFAAEYLAYCLSMKDSHSKNRDLVKLVFTSVLIEPKYQVVRSFLNDRLAKWQPVPTEQLEMSHTHYGDCITHTWLQERELMYATNKHTAFHISAGENNTQIINFLLVSLKQHEEMPEIINSKDTSGKTALHISAEFNQIGSDKENEEKLSAYGKQVEKVGVQLLVEAGVNINITDIYNRTSLYVAAEKGNFPVVKYLLSITKPNIANINDQSTITYNSFDTKRDFGWTPLHVASAKGHLKIVRLLKARPDAVEIKDRNGNLPLDLAISNGHLEIVQFLRPHDNIDYLIRTTVYTADVESLEQYLRNNDVDVNVVLAAMSHLHIAAFRGHFDVALLLINRGAKVLHRRDDGFTPVHAAASNGHLEVLKLFAEKERNSLDVISDDGWQILHAASQNGHLEIVRYLIEDVGQNVNLVDFKTDTPLHTAAFHDKLEVVKYLMEVANIDRNPINKYGASPIILSVFHNSSVITKYLLNREDVLIDMQFSDKHFMNDIRMTMLHIAAAYDSLEIIELLVEKGFPIDVGSDYCFTPLHAAALFNSSKVADYLIERGASVDAQINIWKALECLQSSSLITTDQLGRQTVRLAKWSIGFVLPNFTPSIIYESCGYTQCPSLRIKSSGLRYYSDCFVVRILKGFLNIVRVREPLRELKNYIEKRKGGPETPIGAALLLYASESAKPRNRDSFV